MNKKTLKLSFFYIFLILFMFCAPNKPCSAEKAVNENTQSAVEQTKTEEESEFNFIKSNNYGYDFLYSDNWLLIGGIVLIIVSIAGVTITLNPKVLRSMRKNKKQK